MNVWDVLILLAVAALVLLAVRAIRRGGSGSCHGGSSCHGCSGNCANCEKMKNEK